MIDRRQADFVSDADAVTDSNEWASRRLRLAFDAAGHANDANREIRPVA